MNLILKIGNEVAPFLVSGQTHSAPLRNRQLTQSICPFRAGFVNVYESLIVS
jgi:hypothetical protein